MNLTDTGNTLPYIIIPELNIKVLIDTGSTRSFISPKIAFTHLKTKIKKDTYTISTAHGQSTGKYSVSFPNSRIFKTPGEMKFYVFNFHQYFDALLGMDNLQQLKMNINLSEGTIENKNTKIKLLFRSTQPEVHSITIPSETEQIVEIPVENMPDGDIFIPDLKFGDTFVPAGVSTVKNNKVTCSLINPTSKSVDIKIMSPIASANFDQFDEIKYSHFNTLNNIENRNSSDILNKIKTDHMNSEEKLSITNLIKEYTDIFYREGEPLTFTNQVKHSIKLSDQNPVYTRNYRYPQIYRDEIQSQIQKMLDQEIIRPSNSPWSSPIWIVPKKLDSSGKRKWRIVIDYRKLNEKTIHDRFPLPNITDLLDRLGRCQYFTTLDLASGFYQIEVDDESIPKTAFNTDQGHFEYLRMPMGLKNAPATFQRAMNDIFRDLINDTCLIYLDDILIFSPSLQEHISSVTKVFKRLRQFNLKIQLDKSHFLSKEVSYLGHIVTPDGVKPNPAKISAIQNYPIPKTTKQIKSFLGLLGYYRKFIRDFARLTKPLTKRLKKDTKININDPDYRECFELCKKLLTNDPILQYPDFKKSFILTTDASNYAIGAVLSQGKIGSDLPVAYASRTLSDAEQNYSTIEKELLGIVWAVKYFRPYLYGRKFTIVTDHQPLQWLFSLKEPSSSKLIRWRLKLEEYDYEIVYKKGTLNTNADALSRPPIDLNALETKSSPDEVSSIIAEPDEDNINLDELVNERYETLVGDGKSGTSFQENPQETDRTVGITFETNDQFASDPENDDEDEDEDITIHSNAEHPIIGIPIAEKLVNIGKNQIIIKEVPFTDKPFRAIILHKTKQRFLLDIPKHDTEKTIVEFIKTFIAAKVKYYLYFETPHLYEIFSRILQANFKNSEINFIRCTQFLKDITDDERKTKIIKSQHEGLTNHRGIEETARQIKTLFYWPGIDKSVQIYINDCEICQMTKYDRRPLKLLYNVTPTPTKPFEIVHVDTVSLEKTKFLTIICAFSKYAQAYALCSAQGTEIANKLLDFFSHHGICKQIISDNGGEFKNTVVQQLLALHKVETHFISAQHPESNGIVERFHSTIIEHIRLLNNRQEFKNDPISTKVKYAIIAYNNTTHSATKLKPMDVINGHFEPNDPFEMDIEKMLCTSYVSEHKSKLKHVYQNIAQRLQENKEKVISKLNKNREETPKIPEKVFVQNKQKQSKTKDKYKPENIIGINPELKTAEISPTHHNTSAKIHLSTIKRPKCVSGPSAAQQPGTSSSRT